MAALVVMLLVWCLGADRAHSIVLEPLISGKPASFVEEHGDVLWLGTSEGVWRLEDRRGQPEHVAGTNARFVKELGGLLWLGTGEGLWRLDGPRGEPEPLGWGNARFVKELGGVLWLGTDGGLWRLDDPRGVPQLVGVGRTSFIEERGDVLWVGSGFGLWRLVDPLGAPELMLWEPRWMSAPGFWVPRPWASFIEERGSVLWLGTKVNLGRLVEPLGAAEPLLEASSSWLQQNMSMLRLPEWALFVEERGGLLWLGTSEGLWRLVDPHGEPELLAIEGEASFVEERGGLLWLGTSEGLWRLVDPHGEPEPLAVDVAAEFVEERGGVLWLGTSSGLWRLVDPRGEPEHLLEAASWREEYSALTNHERWTGFVEERGGMLWLGTADGIWRLVNPHGEPEKLVEGHASFVEERDGVLWLGTSEGLWRLFDAEPRIVGLRAPWEAAWWQRLLSLIVPGALVGNLAVADVAYEGPQADLILVPDDPHFSAVIEADLERFDAALGRGEFLPRNTPRVVPSGFPTTLHVAVRDAWGNEHQMEFEQYVLPAGHTLAALAAALPPAILLLALGGAPYVRACHTLIMNPYVRGIASFGIVPLILTLVPPARRHVLRRYRKALLASEDIRGWGERFVPPEERFTARHFAGRMRDQRRLLIVGVSGVGKTAFLRHLAFSVAHGQVRPGRGPAPLPVYLPLGRYGKGDRIEAMIRAQLENLGGLTDDGLVDWMIRHGGFLFLLDGLNEIGPERREDIASFVERRWTHNWIVAASQEAYEDQFGHWGAVDTMPRLPVEGIKELMRRRLGDEHAEALLAKVDAAHLEVLSLPQNLELALELAAGTGKLELPATEDALYQAVFERQFAAWRADGKSDFVDRLSEAAYTMLRDRTDARLPPEVAAPMIERKLMRRLGDAIHFSHDKLRAYAASLHFTGRWRSLLASDHASIDANWDALLRFSAAHMRSVPGGDKDLESLLFGLLAVEWRRAAALFDWLEETEPGEIGGCRAEFDRQLGEVMRRSLRQVA